MAAGMILAGLSDREHGSGSKRSFPKNKGANTNSMAGGRRQSFAAAPYSAAAAWSIPA